MVALGFILVLSLTLDKVLSQLLRFTSLVRFFLLLLVFLGIPILFFLDARPGENVGS